MIQATSFTHQVMLLLAASKARPKSISEMREIQGPGASAPYNYKRALERLIRHRYVKEVRNSDEVKYQLTTEGVNFLVRATNLKR